MRPATATRIVLVAFSMIAFLGGAIAQQQGGGQQDRGASTQQQGGSTTEQQGGSTTQQQGGSGEKSDKAGGAAGQSTGGASGQSGGAGQDSSAGQSGQSSTGQSKEKDAPIAGKITLGVTVAEEAVIAKGWRASKLTRSEVYNDKGEKVGRVEDVIVSPDGKLTIAVVDVGGFLGLKRHRVAIPVQQFTQINPPKIVLPGATKDALKQLPEFQFATA